MTCHSVKSTHHQNSIKIKYFLFLSGKLYKYTAQKKVKFREQSGSNLFHLLWCNESYNRHTGEATTWHQFSRWWPQTITLHVLPEPRFSTFAFASVLVDTVITRRSLQHIQVPVGSHAIRTGQGCRKASPIPALQNDASGLLIRIPNGHTPWRRD